jgi:hypothetical protein
LEYSSCQQMKNPASFMFRSYLHELFRPSVFPIRS